MTKGIRRLMAAAWLMGIMILAGTKVEAGISLTDNLPADARIIQAVVDPAFDSDPGEEILLLVEQGKNRWVYLMNATTYGYEQMYHVDLGPSSFFRQNGSLDYYTVLQTGDINGDGITDFWLVFSPDGLQGEIQVYVSHSGTFRNVAEVRADVDLQLVSYQGEWVIHEVNLEVDNEEPDPEVEQQQDLDAETTGEGDRKTGWFYLVKSHVWRDGRFVLEDHEYRFSDEDYLLFAESRWRPQIFIGRDETGHLKHRFGESRIAKMIPRGRLALEALLPPKTFLLDYLPDAALDLDADVEYLLAYLVPDPEDERRVLLQAAIADWSSEERSYRLTVLDCKNYGLARFPEGRFYQPIYLLPGEGLSHPVVVGNAASDKPLLQLTAFANTGEGFTPAASIQANHYLWFTENVTGEGLFYRVIAADLLRDGRVAVKSYQAKADQAFGAYGSFAPEEEKMLSLGDFKRTYYRSEETEWTNSGYEVPVLRTNQQKINVFGRELPDADKGVTDLEGYIARNMVALRIRSWLAMDVNRDGQTDHLALFRTGTQGWPPQYRLGYFFSEGGRLQLQPIGSPVQLAEGNPPTGFYLVDIDNNEENGRELIILRQGLQPKNGRPGVNLELFRLHNGSWTRLHPNEIWYDELQLFKGASGMELAGFQLDASGRTQGNVFEFNWKDGLFQLQKKVPVLSFRTYLARTQGKPLLFQSDEVVWQFR